VREGRYRLAPITANTHQRWTRLDERWSGVGKNPVYCIFTGFEERTISRPVFWSKEAFILLSLPEWRAKLAWLPQIPNGRWTAAFVLEILLLASWKSERDRSAERRRITNCFDEKPNVMNLFRRLQAGLETKLTELGFKDILADKCSVFLLHGRYCRKRDVWLSTEAMFSGLDIKETRQAVFRDS